MSEEKEITVTVGLKGVQAPVSISTCQDAKEVVEKIEKAASEGGLCIIEGKEGQKLIISGSCVGFVKIDPDLRPKMGYAAF